MNTNMKPRTVFGILFVVAGLLKLATLWGILHWSWFETMSEGPWAMYFCIFILLWVGAHLIIDSYRRDPSQWLRRSLPSTVQYIMAATSTCIAARRSTVPVSMPSAAASDWICVRP